MPVSSLTSFNFLCEIRREDVDDGFDELLEEPNVEEPKEPAPESIEEGMNSPIAIKRKNNVLLTNSGKE